MESKKDEEVKVEGAVEDLQEAKMMMKRKVKMWVPAEAKGMTTPIALMIKTVVIKEVEDKGDMDKDLEEVVSEECVSSVVKKGIEPMNVHNTKEGQKKCQKVMEGLCMQMRRPNLNIQMMLKGEKP